MPASLDACLGLGTPAVVAGDPTLDPLDRLIGRAAVDPEFLALLLREPALALRIEPLPAALAAVVRASGATGLRELSERLIATWETARTGVYASTGTSLAESAAIVLPLAGAA